MFTCDYTSPYGMVRLFVEGGRLCRVELDGAQAGGMPSAAGRTEPCGEDSCAPFGRMLDAYFQGNDLRCDLDRLCLDGLSEFRKGVYAKLAEVEFGRLVTYAELARACGRRGAARAVGRALGANPLPLFIPCHRVIAAGGKLGGFGAGVEWKRRLLGHEGWTVRAVPPCGGNLAVQEATRKPTRLTVGLS